MATIFEDIIDLTSVCGPCGDPASPQPAAYWEKSSDNGVTWVQTLLPDSADTSIQVGDQWRYYCPDGYSNVATISADNFAVGLDTNMSRVVQEGDTLDISGFTCSDGTPVNEWQVSFDEGTTWISGYSPDTAGDINLDCTKWRFRCDGDWSDAELDYDVETTTNNYTDTIINIDQGVNQFFQICEDTCAGANQAWQYRIDDAHADEDHALTPNIVVGDRPNSDPGDPEPIDEAWQDIDYLGCQDCAIFSVEEIWPDGINFDPTAPQLGEYFIFYLRKSCDNKATFLPEIKITLQT